MAWSTEEKSFCVTLYLQTKIIKNCTARYRGMLDFNNFPYKFHITRWLKKFKDTGILMKSTLKGQPSTSGKKLTARSPENVDAVPDSVATRGPKKSLWRRSQEMGLSRSSVQRILKEDLQLRPYRIQIKQALTQMAGNTCWDAPVAQNQNWRNARSSPECVVQWWSPLLSIRPHQQQELRVPGISSVRWNPPEDTALCEVHHVGRNLETWHNRTILVREYSWGDSD